MNELIGTAMLTVIFATIVYFVIAGKLRWGFDTTIAIASPIILIFALATAGFSAVFAFVTMLAGILLGWIFSNIIKN